MSGGRRAEIPVDLPPHLRERIRPVSDGPALGKAGGDFVLCWLHHALRAEENPALEVALHMAARLRLPVVAFFGLGGRHRFNADRHHRFMLQGAREAQAAWEARGIRTLIHVPKHADAPSPLPALARRAGLVVSEDFPAPPFPRWTRALARKAGRATWRVDCACVLPMRLVKGTYDRAFSFREATRAARDARVAQSWEPTAPPAVRFEGELGFESLDLGRINLAALVAECEIDHGLPPVAHTRGGASAGLARWATFRDGGGLDAYARRRNDALDDGGTSRMSAYLHHGHVSPFRLAREAAARGGPGATKFLDELLIWRELAYHFCHHHPDPEAFHVLPAWARASLEAHAADARPAWMDGERLARGRTGDPLWDAAQRSLIIHGELHNNLRMTWGKKLLEWSSDPREAMRRLIDLNHRFALDGNDPASYGGLLWCLGLFDRPFSPEQPIYGTVRTRPTQRHARRLDVARYADRVGRPSGGTVLRVAVVGAGAAGLSAASVLSDQGHAVTVFDKARGVGGRCATRRTAHGSFDHGAQYFTVRDPRLHRELRAWMARGVVRRWEARIATFDGSARGPDASPHPRYVAVPGMSALCRHLAEELDLRLRTTVAPLAPREAPGAPHALWDVDGRPLGSFDAVIVTTPPAQAAALLADAAPETAGRAAAQTMAPCWAVLAAFDEPLDVDFDAAFIGGGALSWAADGSSKPERAETPAWVLHADEAWSAAHLDRSPEWVADALLDAFFQHVGAPPRSPSYISAHRWRYARPESSPNVDALWDGARGIGMAGDWCRGGRVEAALLSGRAVAGRLLGETAGGHGAS